MKRLSVAAVCIGVLILAAACSSDPSSAGEASSTNAGPPATVVPNIHLKYSGNSRGPKVAIIGDSITRLATPELEAQLESRYQVNIQAQPGYRIAQMLPTLLAQLSNPYGRPAVVVENLGTNDALLDNPHWLRDSNAMIRTIDAYHIACVVVTTISTLPEEMKAKFGYYKSSNISIAEGLNSSIERVAQDDPNYHVMDWDSAVHGPNSFFYLTDGIHPSRTTSHAMPGALPSDKTGVYAIARLDKGILDDCTSAHPGVHSPS
jgi:hypothetical protein